MSATTTPETEVLHAVPGRLRVHLPGWTGRGQRWIERRLRQTAAVRRAEANPVTRNVLVVYDPATAKCDAVLSAVRDAGRDAAGLEEEEPPTPPVLHEKKVGPLRRARIAVRGLDRDPDLARRVVERLTGRPGVKAWASTLTGRVLVEFEAHRAELEELIADVAEMELPPLADEDRPSHPLDPTPLYQSAVRTAGAATPDWAPPPPPWPWRSRS